MQVNTQNIQRPNLFSDFFTEEIDYKNDYLTYIDTSSNNSNVVHKGNVTSHLHEIVKTFRNNIEKSLKTKKFITSLTVSIALKEIKQVNNFRTLYLSKFKNLIGVKLLIEKSKFI